MGAAKRRRGNQSGVFAASATASVTEPSGKLENKHASTQPMYLSISSMFGSKCPASHSTTKSQGFSQSVNPTEHK